MRCVGGVFDVKNFFGVGLKFMMIDGMLCLVDLVMILLSSCWCFGCRLL